MSTPMKNPPSVNTSLDPGLEYLNQREIEVAITPTENSTTSVVYEEVTQVITNVFQVNAPSGANGQLQFNQNGQYIGDAELQYDPNTDTLTTGKIIANSITITGNASTFKLNGGYNNEVLKTDGNGNLSWANVFPSVSGNTGKFLVTNGVSIDWSNVSYNSLATTTFVSSAIANLVGTAPAMLDTLAEIANVIGQTNDPQYGIISQLANKANISSLSQVAFSGSYTDLSNRPNISNVGATGNYTDLNGKPTIPATIRDLGISEGTNGQVLTTNGNGNYSFTTVASGSNANIGNIKFANNIIYSNTGVVINNSDLTNGQTAGMAIPVQGDGNTAALYNTYGNVTVLAGNIGNSQPVQAWTFNPAGALFFPETPYVTSAILVNDNNQELSVSTDRGNISIWPENSKWLFGADGTLTLPAPLATLTNVNQLATDTAKIYRATNSTDATAITEAWDTWYGDEWVFRTYVQEDESSRGSNFPWHGMPSWEAYPLIMNWNSQGGPGLPPNPSMAPAAKTAQDSYLAYKQLVSSIDIVNGNKTISFDNTGLLSLPGKLEFKDTANAKIILKHIDSYGYVVEDPTLHKTWQFDIDGNLTLPTGGDILDSTGNSVLGGGTANTGNVTFDDNIVIGTGSNDGSSGLYLAPGNASIASSAVQYLRVRGGDYPTHIHLDTGNNEYYDQYFGADSKFVKLEANGNVVINADDYAGNGASWTFDIDGNLSVPGGMLGAGNLKLSPDSTNAASYLDIFLTSGPDLHLVASAGANLILGEDDGPNVMTSWNGNAYIQSWNQNTGDVGGIWTFGGDGNLTLPTGGTLIVSGGIVGSGASPAPTLSGFSSVSALEFKNGTSNVTVNANSNLWKFGTDGNLTIPGSSGGFIKTVSNASIGIAAVDNGTDNPAQLLSINAGSGAATSIVSAYATNATIQTNATGAINTWKFDNAGNLTLPANTFAINYANGTQVSLGSGSSSNISNGNSNVSIATSAGNVVTHVNGSAILTTYSGGIKVGGSGILQSPGGAGSITLNNNGANIPTANITTQLNVTGASGANILGTANTGIGALNVGVTTTPLANTVASFNSNVNYYTQVTLQNKSTGTDATADFVITADNGSDTVNYADFGIINSGYDALTPTNSLGNIVFAADTYLYAQGNTSNASQSGGNLAIGTTVPGKNVKIFAGGITNASIIANIANTGVTVNGNVTVSGGSFVGNGAGLTNVTVNAAGNIQGTSSNVSLVAGSYTMTFDNTGILTLPRMGGDEGGEINFGIPASNTTLSTRVAVDIYQDRFRIFDGSTKGVYIDLSQASSGVGTLLNNRVSAFVNAGTFVTMDLIKATVTTSGNRGLSLATTTGTFACNIGGTYSTTTPSSGGSAGTMTVTTTASGSVFNWGFPNQGDLATYVLTDTTNNRAYRITLQIGASYNNNMISIERLI